MRKAVCVYTYDCFHARSISDVISHALSSLALETVSYWQVGHCGRLVSFKEPSLYASLPHGL